MPRTADSLPDWLSGLDEAELVELLEERPDVVHHPAPRDVLELAERLDHPMSLSAAVTRLPRPAVELLQVLLALGGSATLDRAAQLLRPVGWAGEPTSDDEASAYLESREGVQATLPLLTAAGLAWPGREDRIRTPPSLRLALRPALGLGAPLEVLLQAVSVSRLQQAQTLLGLPRGGTKDVVVDSVANHLSDPGTVRALVASAPPTVAEHLRALAQPEDDDELPLAGGVGGYRQRLEAIRWAGERGLVVGDGWNAHSASMPSQVALALLDDPTVPFHVQAPQPVTTEVDEQRLRSESSVAATEFLSHAIGVLDTTARRPVALLKSGGVGARELSRVAKVVGSDPTTTRLALELAGRLGLLEAAGRGVGVSAAFREWRAAEPAARLSSLVLAWLRTPFTPTVTHDAEGKAVAALGNPPDPAAVDARWSMLGELANLPGRQATTVASVAALVAWARPFATDSQQSGAPHLRLVWREAELLGLLALGALSPLGRALLDDDAGAVRQEAAGLLPASTDAATFGTDLTAMVFGSPSAHVTELLDLAADRESSSGGAMTWRFSPASVRRALDEGTGADALLERLGRLSTGELPQPLGYLITDVARRHGRLRVSDAVSLIRCPDEALLAEVAVDRKLRRLHPRLLAPTVLACAVPADEALTALRAAGYFPMPESPAPEEDPSGAHTTAEPGRHSAPDPADGDGSFDVLELLARTVGGRAPAEAPVPLTAGALARQVLRGSSGGETETERELQSLSKRLSGAEVRQLAFALDHGRPIRIVYRSGTGGVSDRIISRMQLLGGRIWAWCHLRSGQREFHVDRILSVTAVDAAEDLW
ncbi:MAG TPA: helicase C-terminal domain-containing protein [Segeticoccus sp.]|uniref:helicase C-terminal domain-containing protein n=1 Tax=Segeticoccus sp. TaxID=2706531 RepID=UPI002D7F4991|nr:helicase C-terminal domain-containing protein [Segeticoccus sp.]HET8600859.1 helicase C-terminal domain-containing protein [Segeticoccus sp.]